MPQYGMAVYLPAPADPDALSAEYLEALAEYPDKAKALGGKVLGGKYFVQERGFALQPSTTSKAVEGDAARDGTLVESALVMAGYHVVAAPDIEVAVRIAQLHPATREGGIEIRPLYVPPGRVQDDYAD